jgi:hypothetical protein
MDTNITPTKEQIIELLDAWIRRRPGLEFANYGSMSGYRSELRSITRDLHDARELLRAVELCTSLTWNELLDALRSLVNCPDYANTRTHEMTAARLAISKAEGEN